MTYQECKEMVSRPGKFEGEQAWCPHFWDASLDGADDDISVSDDFGYVMMRVTPEDVALFPDLAGTECVYLSEDSQGFVSCHECTQAEWDYFVEENTPDSTDE